MSFPHLDGQMLLRNRSQVLGSEHAGHPRGSPGQGHLPRPLLVHLLHHLAIDELPLLLTGSQGPAQSLSIFQIIFWGNFPTVKTCLPSRVIKCQMSPPESQIPTKGLANILRPSAIPHTDINFTKRGKRHLSKDRRHYALCHAQLVSAQNCRS